MNHEQCDFFGKAILSQFKPKQVIGYSLGEFNNDWENLKTLVEEWWKAYKVWEAQDTLADAYKEQRLTVKGTSEMNLPIQAHTRSANPSERYGDTPWGDSTGFRTPIVKTNASIMGRMNPKVFVPQKNAPSQKTEKGYHDLSALLLNPNADISSQQYKGRGEIAPEQVYVFMPLSYALDQAVFQNINTLAKAYRDMHKDFYDKVREFRSEMTRIKLAAEHDMAVNFVMVGNSPKTGAPKFKYTLISETDISFRDEQAGLVPRGTFKNKLTAGRVEDALSKADPPLPLQGGDRIRLANALKEELKSLFNKEFTPLELQDKVNTLLSDRKALERLGKLKPPPLTEVLARCKELIVANAGGKTKQNYRTTPGILEARQCAAINFQSLVLGQMMRYAEVTIAYRQHSGEDEHSFPKFARFDKQHSRWIVGTVDEQNIWTAKRPEETFPDRPV